MSDTLLILLPALPGGPRPENTQDLEAHVLLLDEAGKVHNDQAPVPLRLAEIGRRYAAVEPGSRAFVVLLPGEDVLLSSVALPSQRQRQVRQALPFLVEENLAEDPEVVHVVMGAVQDDGANPVAVVRRDLVRYWLDALAKEDLYPDTLLPETLLLPLEAGALATLVVDAGRCYLRTAECAGLMLERTTLLESLPICLPAADSTPGRKTLSCWTGDDEDGSLVMELGRTIAPIQVRQKIFEQSRLGMLAEAWTDAQPRLTEMNFLQGEFESTRRRTAARWMLAKVAGLALLVLFSQVVFDIGRAAYLRGQAAAWEQEARALYRELFPQDRRLINLRAQLQNHLDRLRETGSADDFLALMGTAGKYSRAFRADEFVLQRVNFSEQNRSLMLDLHANSLQTLDRYKQALAQGGLQVDIASAVSEDNVVKARLRIGRIQL